MDNYADLKGVKVLVVDDNEYQAAFILDLLSDVKADAQSVSSGAAALELLSDCRNGEAFACVLMDIQMPSMDGFETTRRIRKLGTVSMSRLPIIGMAGSDSIDEDRIFSAGMNSWIQKPVNPHQLYDTLRRSSNQTFLGQAWSQETFKGKSAFILSDDTESIGKLLDILSGCGIETRVFTDFEMVADIAEKEDTFDFAFVNWSDPFTGFSITTRLKLFCHTTFRHLIAIATDWFKIETKATELGVEAFVLMPFQYYNVISAIQKLSQESEENQNTDNADFSGNRILIVDDNEMTAMILQNAFESFGAEADIANGGKAAMEILSSMEPNTYLLVFMDIFMPDMKGFDVASQFRKMDRPDAVTLPIIGMSGNSSSKLVEEAIASGMNALLLKPVTRPSLKMYMEIFLNEKLYGGILSDCMKNQISELHQQYKSLVTDVNRERFTSALLRHAVENLHFIEFMKSVMDETIGTLPECQCLCIATSDSDSTLSPICRVDRNGVSKISCACKNCTMFANVDVNSFEQQKYIVTDEPDANGAVATKLAIPFFKKNVFDGLVVAKFAEHFTLAPETIDQMMTLAGIIALVLGRERHARNASTFALETTFVLDNSPFPVIIAAPDGSFIRGNKWLAKIMGIDENRLPRISRQELFNALRDDNGVSPLEEIASGKSDSFSRLRKVGGLYYQEEFNKVRSSDGMLERIIGTAIDVTEINRMLQREHLQTRLLSTLISEEKLNDALKTALERLGNYYSAAMACVMRLDECSEKSPFFVSFVRDGAGVSHNGLDGKSTSFIEKLVKFYEDNPVFVSNDCNSIIDDGFWGNVLKRKNIKQFCGIRLIVDGRFWGHIGLFFDTTGFSLSTEENSALVNFAHFVELMIMRNNNNNIIIAERDKAIEAQKAKTLFFASVSHDIRTPLNSIMGFARLLGTCTPEEQATYINNILFSGEMLLNIVSDILDLASLDSGRSKFNIAPHDFSQLCKDVMALFTPQIAGRNVSLVVKADHIPVLEFDKQRLSQILNNFISNAVKFTKEGSITLQAKFVKNDNYTGTLEFEVVDTGIGISEKDIAKLAQPFVQVGDRSHGGTGLGLSICKGIIHKMGGRLTIKSELGKGSSFGAIIPGVKYHSDTAAPQLQKPEQHSSLPPAALSLNVLLADDVMLNISVLKAMLKKLGIRNIYTAKDGLEAFEIIQATHIDVTLTDANMPRANGKDLANMIRSDERFKDMPVYVITGETNYTEEPGNEVFNDILFKPVHVEDLEKLFKSICEK